MRKIFLKSILFLGGSFLFLFLGLWGLRFWIVSSTNPLIFDDIDQVPDAQTGLLLGARVYSGGRLSPLLQDRADSTFDLYQANKIQKILVSGDNGQPDYDEVNAIKNYLLQKGVAEADLFLDHAGFDTYDSLYRARDIFEVDSLLIVSQSFHLPRALFLAHYLGLDAVGFSSDRYFSSSANNRREFFANGKAFLNVFTDSKPLYLGPAIPITGDSLKSWD